MSNHHVRPGSHANWCRCRGCRNDIAQFEARQFKGTVAVAAVLLALGGVAWIVLAPLRIWHVTGADGQMHPDAATWIAYGISGGVILAALMFSGVPAFRAAREREARDIRIAEALDIAGREDRS